MRVCACEGVCARLCVCEGVCKGVCEEGDVCLSPLPSPFVATDLGSNVQSALGGVAPPGHGAGGEDVMAIGGDAMAIGSDVMAIGGCDGRWGVVARLTEM